MKKEILKGHLAMLACSIMWGLMAPVCKLALQSGELSSLSMAAFRVSGAALLFWFVSLFVKHERVEKRDMIPLFLASLCGIVFNQGTYTIGVGLTSPADASIITTTAPIMVMLLSAVYLKDRLTISKILGVLVSASGALMLVSGSHSGNTSGSLLGDFLVVFAQTSVAFYFVFFKGLISKYSPVALMKWMFLFSAICWAPFSINSMTSINWEGMNAEIYSSVLYVVVCGTFLTYMLLPVGQRYLKPTVVGMYNYMQPVVATWVTVYWGMDSFGLFKLLAMLLVFGGVCLVTHCKPADSASTTASLKRQPLVSMRNHWIRFLVKTRRTYRFALRLVPSRSQAR